MLQREGNQPAGNEEVNYVAPSKVEPPSEQATEPEAEPAENNPTEDHPAPIEENPTDVQPTALSDCPSNQVNTDSSNSNTAISHVTQFAQMDPNIPAPSGEQNQEIRVTRGVTVMTVLLDNNCPLQLRSLFLRDKTLHAGKPPSQSSIDSADKSVKYSLIQTYLDLQSKITGCNLQKAYILELLEYIAFPAFKSEALTNGR